MKKILVTTTRFPELCAQAKQLLEKEGFKLIIGSKEIPCYTTQELAPYLPDIFGVIAGTDLWDEEKFRLAPNLRVIAKFGTGVDTIDLEKAREHRIVVFNAHPDGNSNAVAELTVGHIISAMRDVDYQSRELRKGVWLRDIGHEIQGSVVGLYGFGDIARKVAKKLRAFEPKEIIAYDKFPNLPAAKELQVRMVSVHELLRSSDVLSLHVPELPENRHLIDRRAIEAMKPGACLVNTARGMLVDTQALCDAVDSGRLAGAALDAYEEEPCRPGDRVLTTPHILVTPHAGAESYEAYTRVSMIAARGIIAVANGTYPAQWLNRW